jgi:hypothetical protein
MNDTVLFILVLTSALVLILGTAYAMDRRRKVAMKAEAKTRPPVPRFVLWIAYGSLVITVLFIIGAFAFREMIFALLAGSFILLYIIAGLIYRLSKPRGM